MENKLFVFFVLINVSSVLSMGKLVADSGPPCAVSSLIPGTHTHQTMKGTCYPSLMCRYKGGEAIGRCGFSHVCCIFPRSCGDVTTHNSTYFTNPGYPSSYNTSKTCLLTIHKTVGISRICQLRLDFMDFELSKPNRGDCDTDFFTVNGQNLNSVVPKICGFNTGQHLYVDIDGVQGPIHLNIQTYGFGERKWNIIISQIECNNPSKAPPNCLQYFMGPNGEITSFNYDVLLQNNQLKSNLELSGRGVGFLNNLDYSICFRKEQYYCTQTYSINASNLITTTNEQSISIDNEWIGQGVAGAGIIECPTDYLLLNGIRVCGDRLNSKGVKHNNINDNEDITDNGSGPFIARFVSDNKWSEDSSRGFKLSFKQNPCLLQFPNQESALSASKRRTDSMVQISPKECKIFSSREVN